MDNDLKKMVALNIHLSRKLKEKSSASTKLDEEISKLERTIKKLEKERFTDSFFSEMPHPDNNIYIRSMEDLDGITFRQAQKEQETIGEEKK